MIGERPPGAGSRERTRRQVARQKVRSARKSRRTRRLERRAQQRRQRARAHLDRVLRKAEPRGVAELQHPQRTPPTAERRLRLAAVFASAACLGAFLAAPLLPTSLGWWTSEPVVVQRVAVQGRVRLSEAEVAQTIDFARGMRVDQIDTDALARAVSEHVWIADARAIVLPEGSLILRIDERKPVATLRAENYDETFLVDANGAVFARASRETERGERDLLALRRTGSPIALNQTGDSLLARGARLAGEIAQRELGGLADASLQLPARGQAEGWILRSADGELKVVLGDENDRELSKRLDRLETLLHADLWAGPPSGRIDMRFEERAILHASVDM